ncbi:MAG: phosphoglucosamine mutase [Bacteroidales bacterium]|jgi:phosphomannomutase|nr:phosphoglucosamine mutase [Bacteroidales bacterium]
MTLIKSISGIRGTIGNFSGDNLTPLDIVKFTAAYSMFLKERNDINERITVVVGRDARISGEMLSHLVCATLSGMGIDVVNIGLSTTPTVEMEVLHSNAKGGIIITASHNPMQWNALKFVNEKGEFLSASEGEYILNLSEIENFKFSEVDKLGSIFTKKDAIDRHIKHILDLNLVDVNAIKARNFKIVIDCVHSTGGLALPPLLKALGVDNVITLYGEPTGNFPHNPEPLPEHLEDICNAVKENKADLGFVVDPDVDRLAIIQENGIVFGEEYTLVAVADYVLQNQKGNTVSNLSSTRALQLLTEKYGGTYAASAVGEVNVIEKMKTQNAVVGGEGNGGVIYPVLHYGRDALVGIALFLSYLAKTKISCSQLKNTYPDFYISKNKIQLQAGMDTDALLLYIKEKYSQHPIIDIDGIRIDFDNEWVHLRKSNTEPIVRIYAESNTKENADKLAHKIMADNESYLKLHTNH